MILFRNGEDYRPGGAVPKTKSGLDVSSFFFAVATRVRDDIGFDGVSYRTASGSFYLLRFVARIGSECTPNLISPAKTDPIMAEYRSQSVRLSG
jgi:hypothetical protein